MNELIEYFEGEFYFLSNFYPVPIVYQGAKYATIEHSFQAAKTLNQEERVPFQRPGLSPSGAKDMGRAITLRSDWEQVKDRVMREQLAYKFSSAHPVLQQRLIDTKDAILIEGNLWHDNIWGDCYCNEPKKSLSRWGKRTRIVKPTCLPPGQNRLGKMLMELRKTLQAGMPETKNICL